MRFTPFAIAVVALLGLPACTPHGGAGDGDTAGVPGDSEDTTPFHAIAEDEVVHFAGTEPFWGGEIAGGNLRWSTPENIDGETIAVARFAGRGGLSFTGTLQGEALDMAITPAACADGMSERSYPYAVTVQLGDRQLSGCGWTDRQPYTGAE